MTTKAKFYQSVILLLGLAIGVRQSMQLPAGPAWLFLSYLGLTVITSLLRLGVPTAAGTISIGFIFILASLAQLSIAQTLVIGVSGTIIHCLRDQGKSIDWLSLAFQTAVVVLGIEAANVAFHRISVLLPGGGLAAALPLAATVLFLVTAFPLAAATAMTERALMRRIWQSRFLWSLPYYLAGAAIAGLLTAAIHMPMWQCAMLIVPLVFLIYRSYGLQLDSLAREHQHAGELATIQFSMVEALALVVESKDATATDHLHRMSTYTAGLGRLLGLSDSSLKALRAAAVLHDIGQVAVPDHIIMKPGRLTAEEFERLKVHPDVGGDIIERAKFPYPVAPIVRAHHERWDGGGYPHGLKGELIPLEARILTAVDTLVALTSQRHYRPAIGIERAIEVVKNEAGRGLDPKIVALLSESYRALEEEARATSHLSATSHARYGAAASGDESADAPTFLATIAAARREEQSLLEFTQILGTSLNLQETLSAIARKFRNQIPFDTMVLYLLRDKRLDSVFIEGENFALFNDLTMAVGEGLSGRVALTRKPLLNADPASEPSGSRNPEKMARLRAALSVPLDGPNGVAGVLTFYSEQWDAFTASQLSLLLAIGPKLAMTVENSIRFREAENQATFDYLTGLPNAGSLFLHLQSELARAARGNSQLAVLVCDLDGFKQVNDRFGHLTGNKLLQSVAHGLKENCREYDFVARMGGDEFVVILPGATEEAVKLRRRRLATVVEEAGVSLCEEKVVGLSTGISYFPDDGRTAEELLANADVKMYEDKAKRKALRLSMSADTAHSWMSPSTD